MSNHDFDADEARSRVYAEVDSISDWELERMARSRTSFEDWIYRTARKIGRIIGAPFRWLANLIEGILDGLFGR